MNIFQLVFLALAVTACASSSAPKSGMGIDNPNQHIAVAVTLATFYCRESRWPNSTDELRGYSEAEQLPLPVAIDWSAITDPRTSLTFSDTVVLRIPSEVISAHGNAISSFNSPPACSETEIRTNVHIDIGD